MADTSRRVTLVMTARIAPHGVADFAAFEERVLPRLGCHGGVLERRLRSEDGTFEMHIVSFASRDGLERFRRDPERVAALALLERSGAATEMAWCEDVAVPASVAPDTAG